MNKDFKNKFELLVESAEVFVKKYKSGEIPKNDIIPLKFVEDYPFDEIPNSYFGKVAIWFDNLVLISRELMYKLDCQNSDYDAKLYECLDWFYPDFLETDFTLTYEDLLFFINFTFEKFLEELES